MLYRKFASHIEDFLRHEPKKILLGDVDCNGVLTASDLSLLKRGLMTDKYDNSVAKVNADVDQSYEINNDDAELLHDFLVGKIDEFPVAERVVDFTAMAQKFSGLSLEESWKKDNENNALYTQRFGADPGWMVYKDRLYVYTTNDAYEYNNGQIQENTYDVRTLNCVSTTDLVNWTDHGAIPVAGNGAGAERVHAVRGTDGHRHRCPDCRCEGVRQNRLGGSGHPGKHQCLVCGLSG